MKRAIETFAVRDSRPGQAGQPRVTDADADVAVGDLFADDDPIVLLHPEFFEDA